MKKITVTPLGVKAILLFASLIPIYIAVYVTLGGDVFLSIFFTVFLIVIVSHLYYGYKWAKYTVALLSQQADERTQKVLLLLKISRWILYALLVFGIAKDLLRLAT
jgi:hypothetical protein